MGDCGYCPEHCPAPATCKTQSHRGSLKKALGAVAAPPAAVAATTGLDPSPDPPGVILAPHPGQIGGAPAQLLAAHAGGGAAAAGVVPAAQHAQQVQQALLWQQMLQMQAFWVGAQGLQLQQLAAPGGALPPAATAALPPQFVGEQQATAAQIAAMAAAASAAAGGPGPAGG